MFFSRPDRIQGLVHPELPIFVTMSVPDNEEKDARTTAIEINKFLYSIVYVNIEYWFPTPLVQSCRRMPSTCAAESTPKTHRKPRWVPFHPCHPWPVCANSQGVERLF